MPLQNSRHLLANLHFPIYFALVAALQQALTLFYRFGGSVVEFSPATRETGVRFPANAFKTKRQSLSRKLFHKI